MESILTFWEEYYDLIMFCCVGGLFVLPVIGFLLLLGGEDMFGETKTIIMFRVVMAMLFASIVVGGMSFYRAKTAREVTLGTLRAVDFSTVMNENEKIEYKQSHFVVFKQGTINTTKTKTEEAHVKLFVEMKTGGGYAFQSISIKKVRFSQLAKGEKPFAKMCIPPAIAKECRDDFEKCKVDGAIKYVNLYIPEESFPPEEISVPTIGEVGN